MCDYSLTQSKSRPAKVGDKLIVHNFGHMTRGFKAADDTETGPRATAVCLLPGTEIAFDKLVELTGVWEKLTHFVTGYKPPVATFREINEEEIFTHHDALEFADGKVRLVTSLVEGQTATVLQLPAEKVGAPAAAKKVIPVG